MDNGLDRLFNESSGVVNDLILQALRKSLGQLLHGGRHQVGGGHRVGARTLVDDKGLRRFAVQLGSNAIVPGSEFDPCDVAQVNQLAPVAMFEQNLIELLGGDEPALGVDG